MTNHPRSKIIVLEAMLIAATAFCKPSPSLVADARERLRQIVITGRLEDLNRPDFSDYQARANSFYERSGFALAWVQNGFVTPQAIRLIRILQQADDKGLHAEDYDGPRWADRLAVLRHSPSAAAVACFDVALTVSIMRYVSDLHLGRVNPRRFRFNIESSPMKYDLPSFLRERLVSGADVEAQLAQLEPPFAGYKRTLSALQRYVGFAHRDKAERLPPPRRALDPGSPYQGIPRLISLLRLLGDLPAGEALRESSKVYDGALIPAVKHFQDRHGLAPDGRLTVQTVKQLNVPLESRVEQLRLTLERWRWVSREFQQPPIVINIPEFCLRAFDSPEKIVLQMNVIVGKAYRHETPIFEGDMKYVVFRPYWDVPLSILRSEIVPSIRRDRSYIDKNNYEIVTPEGRIMPPGEIGDDVLQQLSTGKLVVRQKPGPENALGLVKFVFPNKYNVYLHSTPSALLFSQARRDFSHGCIRVDHPALLAEWVLHDMPGWNLELVRTAMEGVEDNLQVKLTKPIPVLILYGTAVVDDQGLVHFFDDIYGFDSMLEKALAKRYLASRPGLKRASGTSPFSPDR